MIASNQCVSRNRNFFIFCWLESFPLKRLSGTHMSISHRRHRFLAEDCEISRGIHQQQRNSGPGKKAKQSADHRLRHRLPFFRFGARQITRWQQPAFINSISMAVCGDSEPNCKPNYKLTINRFLLAHTHSNDVCEYPQWSAATTCC